MASQQTTHNQHYVWRYYLKPWCTPVRKRRKTIQTIWWNNHNRILNTNVFDICREHNFYEFKPLNEIELFLLKNMFAKGNSEAVKSTNALFVNLAKIISIIDLTEDVENTRKALIQMGEELQGTVEKDGTRFLKALYNGDISFLKNEDDRTSFLMFCSFQFLRTKAKKKTLLKQCLLITMKSSKNIKTLMEMLMSIL